MGDLSDLTLHTDMIRVLVCFVVLASLSLTCAEESKQDLVERSDAEIELVRGVREARSKSRNRSRSKNSKKEKGSNKAKKHNGGIKSMNTRQDTTDTDQCFADMDEVGKMVTKGINYNR